jgi:CRISPR-associated protein Cmr4
VDARMLYLHLLSPLHSGTGQSTDVIDLPVARERVYGWPYVPATSIKGVLRDASAGRDDDLHRAAFGPDTQRASEHAGHLAFTDAHLLCLPVRSLYGTFAWLTCPLALRRWQRDFAGTDLKPPPAMTETPADQAALVLEKSAVMKENKLYLEELDLDARVSPDAGAVANAIAAAVFADDAWRQLFMQRFAIVSDDIFAFFAETATEVTAHIRLNQNKKTVEKGALWYEETVPPETIFSCPLFAEPFKGGKNGKTYEPAQLLNFVSDALRQPLQIGGNASTGCGLVEARLVGK